MIKLQVSVYSPDERALGSGDRALSSGSLAPDDRASGSGSLAPDDRASGSGSDIDRKN